MYRSPIPEIQSPEKFNGQYVYTGSTSPQPTLPVLPQAVEVPQIPQMTVQQTFANDVAIGLQYQMAMYAQCAQGNHQVERKYGPCGIITGVIFFPIGLIALCFDVQKRCARCGASL